MSSFWRDWVVSYDTSHQYLLGQAAVGGTLRLWQKSRIWARTHYAAMLKWARHSQDRVRAFSRTMGGCGAVLVLVLLLLGNVRRIVRVMHEKWLVAHS